MPIEKLIPILYTVEMKKTVEFYLTVLGLTANYYKEGEGWASLQLDSVEVKLAIPPAKVSFQKPVFTGSIYFKTNNVDQLWQRLKDKTKVCYEIENFDYGMREFAI